MANALTVYLFLASACPLSNRLQPDIVALRNSHEPRGVRFETAWDAALAARLGARVTPQAVVVDGGGKVRYRGRIDDRAPALGVYRAPVKHDLRDALDALLADALLTDAAPPLIETPAVGCAIPPPVRKQSSRVLFSKHVAPILFQHCAPCHHQGGTAPFPLVTYRDAAPLAAAIAEVTRTRLMPPWKAAPGPHPFVGARRLTAAQIATFAKWAEGGAPEGGPAPEPPLFRDGWALGPPDLVLRMPAPAAIPAGGDDLYQCIVIPAGVDRDRWVRAYEFRPGNRSVVHHALLFTDATRTARRNNGERYPCFGVPGFLPSGALGGWTPGFTPAPYPPDTAVALRARSDVVLQIHYHPSGRDERDQSEIGLYFTETPPRRRMMDVALGSRDIVIEPGGSYTVRDAFTIPVDVEVTGIIPHAHYICREIRGFAIDPRGRRVSLLEITDWDFNWQQHYRYAKPFVLPAGTRVEAEFVYDNSDANPRNPSRPPERVVWGGGSKDEMAGLHLQVIPVRQEDAEELGQALWGKIMRSRNLTRQ